MLYIVIPAVGLASTLLATLIAVAACIAGGRADEALGYDD